MPISRSSLKNGLGALLALGFGFGLVVLKQHWSTKSQALAQPKPAPLKPVDPKRFTKPIRNPEIELRVELQQALGYVSGVADEQRLELLKAMDRDLSPEEIDALLEALVGGRPNGAGLAWYSSYLHEISCVLQKNPRSYESFARALATLAGQSTGAPVVRDYAIQHLRTLWNNCSEIPELRGSIQSTFWELARPESPVAASALLSLHELGSKRAGNGQPEDFVVSSEEVEPLVNRSLRMKQSQEGIPLRMTAARIAGERRMASSHEDLQKIASSEGEHSLVRLSAIAALTRYRIPQDRALFETLTKASEQRVASAASDALKCSF